mgnify:CR=1 FL=1
MSEQPRHLKAVVLDWAGTMVDHGSLAPMGVFVEAFRRFGLEITIEEARGPMGMAKRAHIATLLALPRIERLWRNAHSGRPPTESLRCRFEQPPHLGVLEMAQSKIDGIDANRPLDRVVVEVRREYRSDGRLSYDSGLVRRGATRFGRTRCCLIQP